MYERKREQCTIAAPAPRWSESGRASICLGALAPLLFHACTATRILSLTPLKLFAMLCDIVPLCLGVADSPPLRRTPLCGIN